MIAVRGAINGRRTLALGLTAQDLEALAQGRGLVTTVPPHEQEPQRDLVVFAGPDDKSLVHTVEGVLRAVVDDDAV